MVRYNYKWIAEPVSNTAGEPKISESNTEMSEGKTIRVSGIVENVNHVAMPRMELEISLYYNADTWYANASADVSSATTTDIEGRFKQDIKLPENILNDDIINSRHIMQGVQETRYCTECGAENKFGNIYCQYCGKKLLIPEIKNDEI